MIKIYIFADSYKHFEEPIKEYEKRLWKSISIIKLKPSKNTNENLVIKEETEIIKNKLSIEKWFKIVLNPLWKSYNTIDFSDLIENKKMTYSNIIFIIWWAFWFDYDELNWYADLNINLGLFTMPHSLALLVILEQIYRSDMIKKGSDYNK
jgi:23S rRNA (pseudouridine1915-N3)-methyltransferase